MQKITTKVLIFIMLHGVVAFATAGDSTCFVREDMEHGQKKVSIGNQWITMSFLPEAGAVCTEFQYRPGQNMNPVQLAPSKLEAGYGILRDQLWEPAGNFANCQYEYKADRTDDAVEAVFNTRGKGAFMDYLRLSKRVSISAQEPAVRIHYELENMPEMMSDVILGLWVHNFIGAEGQKNRYFIPRRNDVMEYTHGSGEVDLWAYDMAQPWSACIINDAAGVAVEVDPALLSCFYIWRERAQVPTLEWRHNALKLPPGESISTDVKFYLFNGLKRVDGVGDGIICALETADNACAVRLFNAGPARPLTVNFMTRELTNSSTWQVQERKKIDIKTAETASIQFPFNRRPGMGICAQVKMGERCLLTAERMFVPKSSTAEVTARLGPHKGFSRDELEKYKQGAQHEISTAVKTPHWPIANPLAGGPIKLLAIIDRGSAREMVELSQRLELVFDSPEIYFGKDEASWHEICADWGTKTLSSAQGRIATLLSNDYQVILLAGLDCRRHLTPALCDLIAKKVEKGTGLVCISPLNPPGLSCLPVSPSATRKVDQWMPWVKEHPHFVTENMPFDVLPKTRCMDYTNMTGEVVAKTGNYPLLSVMTNGQGRVAFWNYDVYLYGVPGYAGNWAHSGLTPCFNDYALGLLYPELENNKFPYWEGHFALLARSILWAGRRENTARINVVKKDKQGQLTISCVSTQDMQASLNFYLQNPAGKPEYSNNIPASLSSTGNSFTFSMPEIKREGIHPFYVKLTDQKGNCLDWAIDRFVVHSPVHVSLSLSNEIWQYDEDITGQCVVSGKLSKAAAVVLELSDYYGRLIERREIPIGSTNALPLQIPFAFSAFKPLGLAHTVSAELRLADGIVLDRQQQARLVWPADPYRRVRYVNWYGRPETACRMYQVDAIYRQTHAIGVDCALDSADHFNKQVRLGLFHNVFPSVIDLLHHESAFQDIKDNAEKLKEYQKAKSHQALYRKPCLYNLSYRKVVKGELEKITRQSVQRGGAFSYCLGDEFGYSENGPLDLGFNEENLKKFSEWLTGKYKTIERLNKEWKRQYISFAEAVPLTWDEALAQQNFPPWADYRDFIEDTVVDFFAFCRDSITNAEPGATMSISGTRGSSTFHAFNWWKLRDTFPQLFTYATHNLQFEQQRSFCVKTRIYPYVFGYGAVNPGLRYSCWSSILHGFDGLCGMSDTKMINPDFTFSRSGEQSRQIITELKNGIWELMGALAWQRPPIAIHFSMNSERANHLMDAHYPADNAGRGPFQKTWSAWDALVNDAGCQYDFVSTEEIEAGELARRGYRLLILPQSAALSEAETSQMASFVRKGGWLAADNKCGLMDEHCLPLSRGRLDDLFGLSKVEEKAAPGKKIIPDKDWKSARGLDDISLGLAKAIKFEKGQALARDQGNAAIVIGREGTGGFVYLNFDVKQFVDHRYSGDQTEQFSRAVMDRVLKAAKISPITDVCSADGKMAHVEQFEYKTEAGRVVAYLAGTKHDENITVLLPRPQAVYDVRRRHLIGVTNIISLSLPAGDAAVLALLPRPPPPLIACADKTSLAPGDAMAISLQADIPPLLRLQRFISVSLGSTPSLPLPRVMRIEIIDPQGCEQPWYKDFVVLDKNGRGSYGITTALNDKPGKWTIKARDILTGQEAKLYFELKSGGK